MDKPAQIVSEVYTALPRLRAVRSSGAKVTLSNGREYIDLLNGKGSVTLGHHHPAVNSAIVRHLESGIGSVSCWSDVHEKITSRILSDVGIDDALLALFSTGTEACRAAVQVARKVTGRNLVASAGYHGWGDYGESSERFLEPNNCNVIDFYFVPELLKRICEKYRGRIALVIFSPDYVHLQPETLQLLGQIARAEGVLLCCDDVKQGYRSMPASIFPHTVGYHADMYTFAKGLSNGHRLSCLVGSSTIMEAAREFTYTAYFDTVPIVAALATLDYMAVNDGYRTLTMCGDMLVSELQRIVRVSGLPIEIYGKGPVFQIVAATDSLEKALHLNCATAGLLLYGGDNQAVSLATNAVVDELLTCFEKGLSLTYEQCSEIDPAPVSLNRRFLAAFRMIDGATDVASLEDTIRWVRGAR